MNIQSNSLPTKLKLDQRLVFRELSQQLEMAGSIRLCLVSLNSLEVLRILLSILACLIWKTSIIFFASGERLSADSPNNKRPEISNFTLDKPSVQNPAFNSERNFHVYPGRVRRFADHSSMNLTTVYQ